MKLKVSNLDITKFGALQLTSGMIGKTIEIEYSTDWNGLTKTAVFSNGKISRNAVNAEGVVEIPAEVLAEDGLYLSVSIYGYTINSEGVKNYARPTLYAELAAIDKGGDPNNSPGMEVSATAEEQLQADVNDLDERVTYIEEHGGGIPDAPVDGKQYARQDGEWTEIQSGGGQGWTDEQIDLLEAVFEKLVYTDAEGGVLARQLINSLRGEPITITFDGATAQISGLNSININYVGTTAEIGG